MAQENINASGFEFYEGIRIAIPGAQVLGLYVVVTETFALDVPRPFDDALAGLVLTLAAGLFLYFVDVPARSQIYNAALPHRVLEKWTAKPPNGVSTSNYYFVLLDSFMPAGIRSRTLYSGSIFKLGFEAIALSGLTAAAVIGVAIATDSPAAARETDRTVLWLALGLHIAAGALGVREGWTLSKKEGRADRTRDLAKRFRQQVGVVGAIVLALAVVAILHHTVVEDHWWSAAVAIGGPSGLWLARYVSGYRPDSAKSARRNVDPPAAALLLCAALSSAVLLAACSLPDTSVLGTGAALGWSGIGLFAQVLLARRGHEKKLWAAYHTQRAWMELRKPLLVNNGRLVLPDPVALDPTAAAPGAPGTGPS
ncbi:hypothetical protein [Conexibacter sp. SYSU D00693]|uniref:hypothetical protein n=1 Tax=Conexibacter sp. SYSU D00693 TaxID=2812560 RepID=UPI00196B0C45|nr:hypothetical protein [Conexibacter sp. SYSU D00693]